MRAMICRWSEDWEGWWHTSCGHAFEFIHDTPEENHFQYCPYCGSALEQYDHSPLEQSDHAYQES